MPFADATGEDLTQCGAVNFLIGHETDYTFTTGSGKPTCITLEE